MKNADTWIWIAVGVVALIYVSQQSQGSPQPGSPNFVGPVNPNPQPGVDSNFVGPVDTNPQPGDPNFVGPSLTDPNYFATDPTAGPTMLLGY